MIDLPPEMRSYVLSYIRSIPDLLNLRLVCRIIRLDLEREILWKGIRFDISGLLDNLSNKPNIPNIPFDHIKIKSLDLCDLDLDRVLNKFRTISELDLSYCPNISSTKSISQHSNLRKISLRHCENITDINISELVSTDLRNRLTMIDLSHCFLVSTISVILLSKCPNLKGIGLSGCDVDDVGLIELGRSCLDMQVIWIDECSKITDVGLVSLKNCKDLRELRMERTNITVMGLAQLLSCCPHLGSVYR